MCFSKSINILLLSSILLIFQKPSYSEWLQFNAGVEAGSSPLVTHNRTDDELITFDVELRGLSASTEEYDSQDYLRFRHLDGASLMNDVGKPELPFIPCFIAVPDNCDLSVTSSSNCIESSTVDPVYPAPLDSTLYEPYLRMEEFFTLDSQAYSSESWFPSVYAELAGEFRLRDQRIAVVNVFPVHFRGSDNTLVVASDIEVSLHLDGASADWSLQGLDSFDRLIGNRLLNYRSSGNFSRTAPNQVYRHSDVSVEPPFVPDYVIIVADGLDGIWIDQLASHRANLNGFGVVIAKRDDIWDEYAPSEPVPTADMIRDCTESLWNWGSPGESPVYLLLIGDHDDWSCTVYPWFLPTAEYAPDAYGNRLANDDWYVMFDESRSTFSAPADMIVGRLTPRTVSEVKSMIVLMISYEGEASTHTQDYLDLRRSIARLAGSDNDGGYSSDEWRPSAGWADSLRQWLGYGWDNYYCGDGEDTYSSDPPNPDGSSMTSIEWVNACMDVFTSGSQLAIYINHGHFHFFSAGLNFENGAPGLNHFGIPDSIFDCDDIRSLNTSQNVTHIPPFILSMCCSNGTFNHSETQHLLGEPPYCFNSDPEEPPVYDYGTDCLAESFLKNTLGGAIGVFASTLSSNVIPYYDVMGCGIIESIYYRGISRTGDAITAARLENLEIFWDQNNSSWDMELAKFNLLGDPAVDIGDRVIYRSLPDLLISPDDIEGTRYPTRSVNPASTVSPVRVTVRNIGAERSGRYTVTLEITREGVIPQVYSITDCPALPPGAEATHTFDWIVPESFPTPVDVEFHANVTTEISESWTANNDATVVSSIVDFYPNNPGWPVSTQGSIKSPPLLADIDADINLEIVAVVGNTQLSAWNHDSDEPVWTVSGRDFNPINDTPGVDEHNGYTIPAAADLDGNGTVELIVDTKTELLVLDGATGNVIHSFQHEVLGSCWMHHPHSPAVGDIVPESGTTQLEIALPVNNTLYILGVQGNALQVLDSFGIKPPSAVDTRFCWVTIEDIDAHRAGDEVIVSGSGLDEMGTSKYWTRLGLYSTVAPGAFYAAQDWQDENMNFNGIPAVGELTGTGERVALSQRLGNANHNPAFIVDPAGIFPVVGCVQNPSRDSEKILCCMMADWVGADGLDRVIAPAENQSFVWDALGNPVWFGEYSIADDERPPFGALGNLGDTEFDELITGTRAGSVFGYDFEGVELNDLGFPYLLPSEVYGGYVIADLDNDGKVEVVFGTMDNYLHIWELGDCAGGYSPWPQCQHDAMRTGVPE